MDLEAQDPVESFVELRLGARHRLGFVGANAGVDQSNIDHSDGECALLLPEDPDRSAKMLRKALTGHFPMTSLSLLII